MKHWIGLGGHATAFYGKLIQQVTSSHVPPNAAPLENGPFQETSRVTGFSEVLAGPMRLLLRLFCSLMSSSLNSLEASSVLDSHCSSTTAATIFFLI